MWECLSVIADICIHVLNICVHFCVKRPVTVVNFHFRLHKVQMLCVLLYVTYCNTHISEHLRPKICNNIFLTLGLGIGNYFMI